MIAWPSHGTRFSAQSLLCPRMDARHQPDSLAAAISSVSASTLADVHSRHDDRLQDWDDLSPSDWYPESRTTRATAWWARCQVRSQQSMLIREQARFGALQLPVEATAQETAAYETKKGQLLQSIESRQLRLAELKAQRKNAPKHVLLKELPQEDRFARLVAARKHLVDTVKLAAYRAETALVAIARESLSRPRRRASPRAPAPCQLSRSATRPRCQDPKRAAPSPEHSRARCRAGSSLRGTHGHGDPLPRHRTAARFHPLGPA